MAQADIDTTAPASAAHPVRTDGDPFDILCDMEDDFGALEAFAHALVLCASGLSDKNHRGAIARVAWHIVDLAESLEERWTRAWRKLNRHRSLDDGNGEVEEAEGEAS